MAFTKNIVLLQAVLQACIVLSIVHNDNKPVHDNTTYESSKNGSQPANAKQVRWSNGAYDYIRGLDCSQVYFTTAKECHRITKLSREHVNIYIADPSAYGKLRTVIPDDDLDHSDIHDAVVVLDPHPDANLGHLVVIFYIDLYLPKMICEKEDGVSLEGGECMTLAMKRRCRNALERRSRGRRNFARRCEINFIPLVHLDTEYDSYQQKLTCRSNIPGFGKCPELREMNASTGLICNPLRDNTKRCETSHEHVHTSCRVFEICDQAVIISGGWNRWTSRSHYKDSAWAFYHMIKEHGFIDRNIKVFYANGDPGIPKENSQSVHEVYPAAYKTAMRYHIQKICALPHCADSLLIYMNGPSRSDGTTLLWDINQDGIADDEEIYKFEEFLGDIANCRARHVHVILDQSYSGEVARGARRSQNHRNVAVYASSKDHEYAWGSDYSQHWTSVNHTQKCMKETFKEIRGKMHKESKSTPDLHQGDLVESENIFGAPCDVTPPFTFLELEREYRGCQNLPTSIWLKPYANADITFHNDIPAASSGERTKQIESGGQSGERRQLGER